MNIYAWAQRWSIPPQAMHELQTALGAQGPGDTSGIKGNSEDAVQAAVRLEAADKGLYLWRNNVGALLDSRGVPVRYGLANDSKDVNKVIKSADLIGIRPVIITPGHVGQKLGVFVSREIKRPGWKYSGNDPERAQLQWATLVQSLGGDACFAAGVGTL